MLASVASLPASAAMAIYSGIDYGAYSVNPHPQSNAAAAAFDAAANATGALQIIDFENMPLGSFSTLTVAPGVQLAGFPDTGQPAQSILNAAVDSQDAKTGYNLTVGGSKFNQLYGGSETFSFSSPILGFGVYVVGIANTAYLTFNDGSDQVIPFHSLFDLGIFGGVTFVGFINPDKPISSVTLSIARSLGVADRVGIDDVRYVTSVPEPMTGGMLSAGLLFVALATRRHLRARRLPNGEA